MKILQKPISDNHKSAMFFEGVIATGKDSKLVTVQSGEIMLNGKYLIGKEIIEVAKTGIIDDDTIEEYPVDIHVDKFFTIEFMGNVLEDIMYVDYDEAIEEYQKFLNKI
jgi:hypothetical protein